MHNFTLEDLVQYLYNETSQTKTAHIKAALKNDWSLKEKFEEIYSAKQKLKPLKMQPRQQTIHAILGYAKKNITQLSN